MKLLPAVLLGLSTLALAAPARYEMQSYANVDGKVQPVSAWCDAPNAVIALGNWAVPASTQGPLGGFASLSVWTKTSRGLAVPFRSQATVGEPDPGAGQVFYPLSWANGKATVRGLLHLSNVENVRDPAYRMTHINAFQLGDVTHRCRYVPQAAFVGVTAKRTVIVWNNGKTATYATRNFDGTPGVQVTSETRSFSVEGGRTYAFTTKDGYTYRVVIDDYGPGTGATLSVTKGSSFKGSEPFLAYSISLPAKEQP